MSNVSSVTSSTSTLDQTANQSSAVSELAQNFQAIGSALQSGNISTAQSALSGFQQSLQGNSQGSTSSSASPPFGKNGQANADYQNLTTALKSGNLSTAQKAYASLKDDLKSPSSTPSTQSVHKGHHRHHRAAATDSTTSSTTSTSATSPSTVSAANSTTGNTGILNMLA